MLFRSEKPGGHGERSVAVGTIDMAVWDAVAKIAGMPLFRLLAARSGVEADPKVFVYAAGGYYYPGKDLEALCAEMRRYIDRGYSVVKMKIGGADLAEDRRRIEAVLAEIRNDAKLAVDARAFRSGDRHRLCHGAHRLSAVLVRGAGRPPRLSAASNPGGILSWPHGNRRKPVQPPGRM